MGRNLELGHLSEEECERILQVMQRDFDLRQKEKGRLNKIEEEMKEEDTKTSILAKQKGFNDNCCMRCFSKFIFIFNQKVQCLQCQYYVCKTCAVYNSQNKQYVCLVCRKQREVGTQSCEWFYSQIKDKFKRFGSAKVVRSLYKRKTDSDSENDSGYDPSHYSNSLPVGKRTRKTIEGFFSDLNNQQDPPQDNAGSEVGSEGYDIVDGAEACSATERLHADEYKNERLQQAHQESPKEKVTTEQELSNYRTELNQIVDDIHKMLENNIISPADLKESPTDNYDGLLGTEQYSLCTALASLAGGLQQTETGTDSEVKNTIVTEVEKYVGYPVQMEESTYKSSDPKYWDPLAREILYKVVQARWEADERRHLREEEKVRRDLTKLSNQVHISQLNEMLLDSDTPHDSTFADTDNESHYSEQPDSDVPVTSTPRYDVPPHSQRLNQTVIPNIYAAPHHKGSSDDVDLDDLVALNTEEALQANKARVLPLQTSDSAHTVEITVTTPQGETIEATKQLQLELTPLTQAAKDKQPVVVSRQISEHVESNGEVQTGQGLEDQEKIPIEEPLVVKQLVMRETAMPGFEQFDEEEADLESVLSEEAAQRLDGTNVPLPSFDNLESLTGLEEIDLDDISRYDEDEDYNNTTLDSEFLLGESWDATKPASPLFKDRISAYDNFGERKIGKDQTGPLLMFVPHTVIQDIPSPTVGDKSLDDLSDLSENEEGNGTLEDLLSDSDLEEDGEASSSRPDPHADLIQAQETKVSKREYLMFSPASGQSTLYKSGTTSEKTKLTPEQIEKLRKQKIEEAERAADKVEDDPEDADPRFVIRPETVTVPVGEPARFTCQVTGTKPLDVFWYKENEDISVLDDDPDTEISSNGDQHTLEVFNTTDKSTGRYVCIAINDKGRNHKPFRLLLSENKVEPVSPEFLKGVVDTEILEGEGITFRCKVKGRPQPHITWYKDGHRIINSKNYQTKKLGNRDYTLHIDYATLDDDAEYMVVARNVAGEARSTAQLLVEAKTQENTQKYADLEEAAMAQQSAASRFQYPGTEELLRIAEQVHSSRTMSPAPNSPNTSKLSSIHNQIDEMDRKLNSLEDEVHQSMFSRSDSTISGVSDDSMTNMAVMRALPATNSLRESILREHDESYAIAQSMRRVTSSALEMLETSDTLMKATKDLGATLSASPPTSEPLTHTPLTPRGALSELAESSYPVDSGEDSEELQLSYSDFELLYENGAISKEQLRSGRVKRADGEHLLERLGQLKVEALEKEAENTRKNPEPSAENMLLKSIDCGLKRVPSKRYKRDFIINRSPQVSRKHLGTGSKDRLPGHESGINKVEEMEISLVDIDIEESYEYQDEALNTSLDDSQAESTPGEIYMTAGKMYGAEERLKQLEGNVSALDKNMSEDEMDVLEDQVAQMAAHVTQSDRQVSKIEKQVSNLQQKALSSHHLEPTSPTTINQSENRTPTKEASPTHSSASDQSVVEEDVPLPSVKNLRSLFSTPDDSTGVRRVYSLTGRDLPKQVREKLRDQGPDVVPSSNVRPGSEDTGSNRKQRQAVSQVFNKDNRQTAPKTSTPNNRQSWPAASSELKSSPWSSASSPPQSPTSPSASTGRSSTIMARAAFWDRRVIEGQTSDQQLEGAYPALPEENFKNDDDVDDDEEYVEEQEEEAEPLTVVYELAEI